MLRGENGVMVQKSMDLLVTLGEVFEAKKLGKVTSVHVSGVSYKNIGDPGLEFLEDWANKGASAIVHSTMNPCAMDIKRWREFGINERFAMKQICLVNSLKKMGIEESLTCVPYLIGNKPKMGEHIAWAESSAIAYANSVLGARTNREGGPTALASAVTGRTPIFGYHLDEQRRPTHEVFVKDEIRGVLDYSALGYYLGKLEQCVPLFRGLKNPSLQELKALSAGIAASGSVALYHIQGITPEAKKFDGRYERVDVDKKGLEGTIEKLSTGEEYEHICIGCPHCSLEEIAEIADMIRGRRMRKKLWIFTSSAICREAEQKGYFDAIERAGGKVISDTCMVVAPIKDMGVLGMMTNSCKAAHYVPNTCGVPVTLNNLEGCVEAAFR